MRKWFTMLWLIVPIALLAYHYGPGQVKLARDHAARQISAASAAEERKDWKTAEASYRKALEELPATDVDARFAVQLAHAKTRPFLGQLPEAMEQVDLLLEDALRQSANTKLHDEIRSVAGTMHYHVAWLMRLEGAEADEWTEQTEAARQHFRLLAEVASANSDPSVETHQKNLEAVIRLARMDLDELKAKPLPSECNGNGDCAGKCRSQKKSRNKGKGNGNGGEPDEPQDIRKTNSAGFGERPKGGS